MYQTIVDHLHFHPSSAHREAMKVPMLKNSTTHMKPTMGCGPTFCTRAPDIGMQTNVARLLFKPSQRLAYVPAFGRVGRI